MKKIVLFGASKKGGEYLKLIGEENIVYFCDNDISKKGGSFYGKKIIDINELVNLKNKVEIVISSMYDDEIYKQLCDLGLEENVNSKIINSLLLETSELFLKENEGYFSGIYDDIKYDDARSNYLKHEYIYGKKYMKNEEIEISSDVNAIVPVLSLYNHAVVNIKCEGKEYKERLNPGRYYYYKVSSDSKFIIESNRELIVGHKIKVDQEDKHKSKLVMLIYIDSLSQNIIDEMGLNNIMPNTAKFFEEGMKFNSSYCNADWTLPCVATIFTGKSPYKHGILHYNNIKELDEEEQVTQIFKKNGYLTSHFTSNWRGAPEYGYIKGFDRTVYVPGYTKGNCVELIANIMEHIRAFPKRDHYIALSLYDLHHLQKDHLDISNQILSSVSALTYKDDFTGKSVNKTFDPVKKEIYINEIKRLDFYMRILYSFLEDTFTNDEMAVVFSADHGVSYIQEKDYEYNDDGLNRFRECMLSVPMMIKGGKIKSEDVDCFAQNTNIYNILRSILEEQNNIQNDVIKKICNNEYIYNESIYPLKTYKCNIIDKKYEFIFESENQVSEECKIDISSYSFKLYDRIQKKYIIDNVEEIAQKYIEIVKEHLS
ncbi:sulfatase-like hydrolase/transferase [Clostridium saccharoperbutylacetonicum]|uniref:sulfatase-like hydrolase/transferase n=1 Tax=Clostridium saccharoperbutylacetonicum TaxID=36745 RepID=UPI00156F6CFD|nr:sulfatase-like hydrolase/transferase [Clostridium saccharoperbutylacetonicum]NSB32890.1 hypothetical protein [Clostridium saccharoperbutylacetonicum]